MLGEVKPFGTSECMEWGGSSLRVGDTADVYISYLIPVHHEVGESHVVVETDLAGWNTGRGEYLE